MPAIQGWFCPHKVTQSAAKVEHPGLGGARLTFTPHQGLHRVPAPLFPSRLSAWHFRALKLSPPSPAARRMPRREGIKRKPRLLLILKSLGHNGNIRVLKELAAKPKKFELKSSCCERLDPGSAPTPLTHTAPSLSSRRGRQLPQPLPGLPGAGPPGSEDTHLAGLNPSLQPAQLPGEGACAGHAGLLSTG